MICFPKTVLLCVVYYYYVLRRANVPHFLKVWIILRLKPPEGLYR